jgi:hypothetical protein
MEKQSVDDDGRVVKHRLAFVQSLIVFNLRFDVTAHEYDQAKRCDRHLFGRNTQQWMREQTEQQRCAVFVSKFPSVWPFDSSVVGLVNNVATKEHHRLGLGPANLYVVQDSSMDRLRPDWGIYGYGAFEIFVATTKSISTLPYELI